MWYGEETTTRLDFHLGDQVGGTVGRTGLGGKMRSVWDLLSYLEVGR